MVYRVSNGVGYEKEFAYFKDAVDALLVLDDYYDFVNREAVKEGEKASDFGGVIHKSIDDEVWEKMDIPEHSSYDSIANYVAELHDPLCVDEDGDIEFEHSHPDKGYKRITIESFDEEDVGGYVLGNLFSKGELDSLQGRKRLTIVSRHSRTFEGEPIPFDGYRTFYILYFDGVAKANMDTVTFKKEAIRVTERNNFPDDVFYLLDAGFDPKNMVDDDVFSFLHESGTSSKSSICFWNTMYILEEDRGKGYSEILMRSSIEESKNIHGIDLVFHSAWNLAVNTEGEEKNNKKQNSLNKYYNRFLTRNGFAVKVFEYNLFAASFSSPSFVPEANPEGYPEEEWD